MPRRSAAHLELATQVWAQLRDFTTDNPPKGVIRDALQLGRGTGRVKSLLVLTGGPLTQGELAERLSVDAPYVTLMVDDLESRGLVERTPHPQDRRRKIVALTVAGKGAADKAGCLINDPPPGFDALSAAELQTFADLLQRVVTAAGDRRPHRD